MTAKSSDDRLQKVQSFEVGKSYGGYVVESRTACFVTFEGCPRKKISIVDGVEQVTLNGFDRFNAVGGCIASSKTFVIAAFEEPTDNFWADIAPVQIDSRTPSALPVDAAKEIATPIKVEEPTFQEIADKAITHGYTLINIASAVNVCPMYRLIDATTGQMAHQFSMISLVDVSTWLDAKHQEMIAASHIFNVGQRYEDTSGLKFKVTNRRNDTIELATEFIKITRQVSVDDGGEFVQLGSDRSSRLYAADTPSWFYGDDDELSTARELHEARARMREELNADRVLVFEPRLPVFAFGG